MLCPYHDDTNPSMQVFANGYKCYACGAHGNLNQLFIDLGIEKAPRPDILRSLTEKVSKSLLTNLHCLVGLPNSKPFVGDYRGISKETYRYVDAFSTDSDSIGFPLYDLHSRYRGYVKYEYGGTYINNFTSGYSPFNFQNVNANAPILVEGVFDALSVMECGYKNVIAILGTGQVWGIARLLRQLKAVNVHILFDADESGEYASKKLSEMYRSSKIIQIPENKHDPNNYKFLKELLDTEYNF